MSSTVTYVDGIMMYATISQNLRLANLFLELKVKN